MPPKKKNLRSLSVYPEAPILSKPAYQGELERPVGEGVKIRPAKRDITQLAQTSDPVVVMLSFAGMRWQNFDKYTESLYAVTIALRSVQASGVASHSLLSPGTMDASTPCFSSRHRQLGLPKTPAKTETSSPVRCVRNSAITGNACNPRSVTTSGRRYPASTKCEATSRRAPAPNRMAVGKEKSIVVMGIVVK